MIDMIKDMIDKVIEKAKFTSLLDQTKPIVAETVIDAGANMVALPQNVVENRGLKKIRETRIRYVNNKTELESKYGLVTIEIKRRTGNFDVLAESEGSQPLIWHVVLNILDLVVDPRTSHLYPIACRQRCQ